MSSYIHSFEDLMPERTVNVIQEHFIDNLEPLQRGVHYRYKDKIWTIRLVLILSEDCQWNEVTKIFFLVHSTKNSYVYRFNWRNHCVVTSESKMVPGHYLITNRGMPLLDNILNSERCGCDVEAPKVSTYRQDYFLKNAWIRDIPESIFLKWGSLDSSDDES